MLDRILVSQAVIFLILTATPSRGANSVAVTSAAAQVGDFGVELLLDGSTNEAYIQDNSPNGLRSYRLSFWFHINTVFMSNCGGTCSSRLVMLAARQEVPTPATVFRIILARLAEDGVGGARYSLRFGVRNDNGDFVFMGGVILTEGVTRKHVTIEWQAGDPFTHNGLARLYTSNDGGTPNLAFERTDLMNGTMVVDHLRIGAVSGLADQPSDVDTRGSFYLDELQAFPTLLP